MNTEVSTMPLPTPKGRQREVLVLSAQGHHVVLGTAGSGKTTLAILRAAYLSDKTTDHNGRTLLVTFNRSLVAYMRYFQDVDVPNVKVENYHTFARGYLAKRGLLGFNSICNPSRRSQLIEQALEEASNDFNSPIFSWPTEIFSDEFKWIAQNGILSADEYHDAERIGRGETRIIRRYRKAVFEVYQRYVQLRTDDGWQYDWDDLATSVINELNTDCSERLYKHIIIDEGQDFSPQMIWSLVKAIPEDGSLTFFGDVAQQIYGHRISWRSAGLSVSEVWEFKDNYRNSKQIAQLALEVSKMPYFVGTADLVEPVSPTADGPLPTLVECSNPTEEIKLIINQAQSLSRTQSIAILLKKRDMEKQIDKYLPSTAIRLDRDLTYWDPGPGIYYGTYHSAKGLEFDTVLLPFCQKGVFPNDEEIEIYGHEEALRRDGRLFYVGVTRAKTRLIITYCGELAEIVPEKDGLFGKVKR